MRRGRSAQEFGRLTCAAAALLTSRVRSSGRSRGKLFRQECGPDGGRTAVRVDARLLLAAEGEVGGNAMIRRVDGAR